MRDLKSSRQKKVKQNRRKQQKQARDWKKIFHRGLRISIATGSAVLLTSGALLTAQMLLESGYFGVNKVRVENQMRVTEGDILEASDIRIGDSIFDLDLHLIGRKIEENPWIASAQVGRVFPDEVSIRVVEREPRAIIDVGYLYYLDETGEVFKLLDSQDDLDFPVITGVERQQMLEHADEVETELNRALTLMKMIESRKVFNLDDVSEVHLDRDEGLTVYTRVGGVPIQMGKNDFERKLRRLERIYQDLSPRLMALKYINLNVADRVIVKVDVKRAVSRS